MNNDNEDENIKLTLLIKMAVDINIEKDTIDTSKPEICSKIDNIVNGHIDSIRKSIQNDIYELHVQLRDRKFENSDIAVTDFNTLLKKLDN